MCTGGRYPSAALRAEIRALRDNGVYGSSMVPYLQVLRAIFDTTEDHMDDVDEEPEEFSESDESSSSDEDEDVDDDDDDDDDESEEDESDEEEESEEVEEVEVADAKMKMKGRGGGGGRGVEPVGEPSLAPPLKGGKLVKSTKPTKGASGGKPKGSSRGGGGDGDGPSQYQLEMRKRYNAFTRFLGGYFASERKEEASIAELLSHPEATRFGDDEVVSFLDMMTRENKVMLHEGKVFII